MLCCLNYTTFWGIEVCELSVKRQIQYYKGINGIRQFIVYKYLFVSVFVTPFLDIYFGVFTGISTIFAIEITLANFLYG